MNAVGYVMTPWNARLKVVSLPLLLVKSERAVLMLFESSLDLNGHFRPYLTCSGRRQSFTGSASTSLILMLVRLSMRVSAPEFIHSRSYHRPSS